MTVISSRFAGPAIALLAIAALPVCFHAVVAPIHDDCANPEAFFGAARIGGAEVGTLGAELRPLKGWMREFEGAEGTLIRGAEYYVAVRIVRTFEPSLVYVSPMRFGIDGTLYLQSGRVHRLKAGNDVLPVHWISYGGPRFTRIEGYLFFHDGVPVSSPLRSGLKLALPQLVGGTRPVTVLIASGLATRLGRADFTRAAERWFATASQQLEAACGS